MKIIILFIYTNYAICQEFTLSDAKDLSTTDWNDKFITDIAG